MNNVDLFAEAQSGGVGRLDSALVLLQNLLEKDDTNFYLRRSDDEIYIVFINEFILSIPIHAIGLSYIKIVEPLDKIVVENYSEIASKCKVRDAMELSKEEIFSLLRFISQTLSVYKLYLLRYAEFFPRVTVSSLLDEPVFELPSGTKTKPVYFAVTLDFEITKVYLGLSVAKIEITYRN